VASPPSLNKKNFELEKEVRLACSHTPLASADYVSPVEGIGKASAGFDDVRHLDINRSKPAALKAKAISACPLTPYSLRIATRGAFAKTDVIDNVNGRIISLGSKVNL
jgi:hypothetical protein